VEAEYDYETIWFSFKHHLVSRFHTNEILEHQKGLSEFDGEN